MNNNSDLLFEEIRNCKNKQQVEFLLYDFFMSIDYNNPLLGDIIKKLKEGELKDIANTLYMVPVHQIYKKTSTIQKISTAIKTKDTSFVEETYNDIMDSYKTILEKTIILSNELGVNNSLEMSILFSYLLYSGYYSKSGKHNYKIEGRTIIPGMFFYEIFNGGGVCLNYSSMLSDLLNAKGYNAGFMANKLNHGKVIDYRIPIERGIIKPNLLTKLKLSTMGPLTSLVGNHAVTLIIDNDRPYIYDSTNLLVFECISNRKATSILNNVDLDLKPYLSAMFNDEIQMKSFKTLAMTTNFKSPYNELNLMEISNESVDECKSNENLLIDFHSDSLRDINNVVNGCRKLIRK